MSRIVKSLKRKQDLSEQAGHYHREHRSKKGRKPRDREYFISKDFKRRRELLVQQDYG